VIAKGNVVDGLKGPNAGKGTFEYFHSVLEKELPIAHARRLIHRVLRGGFIGMDGNQIGSVGAHNISENWSFIAPKIIEVLVQESRGSVTQAQAEYALMIASKFMTITHEVAAQEYEMRSKKPYELRDLVHFPERVDYLFANGRKAAPDILRTFIFCNDKVWDALEEYFVKVMGLKESELVKPLILYNDLGTIAVTVEQTDSSRPLIKVEYASVHPPHPSSTFLQVFEDHTTPQKASVKYRYDGKGDGSFVYDTLGNSYRAAEAQWDKRGYVVGEGEMMWENVDWSIFSDEIYSSWTDHLFSVKGFMDELITKINFSAGELSQETFYSALKSKIDYTAKNAFVIREGQITLDFIMQQYGLLKRDKDGNIVFVLDEDAGKIAEDYQKMMAEYEALKPDQKDKKFKEYKGKHLALANRLAAHPAFEQRVQAKAFKEYSKFNDNQKKLAADTVALALQDKFVRSKDELQMAMQEMIMAAALVENYYRKHPGEPGRWKEFEDREATEILENAADAGFIRRSRIPWLLGQVQGLAMFREAFQHALSERLRKEGT
jgi:hypothetical protein